MEGFEQVVALQSTVFPPEESYSINQILELCTLGDGITGYIASMAVAGVMLNKGLISKREFVALEKQLVEKFGIPENSIYRDYRIVKVPHSSAK